MSREAEYKSYTVQSNNVVDRSYYFVALYCTVNLSKHTIKESDKDVSYFIKNKISYFKVPFADICLHGSHSL